MRSWPIAIVGVSLAAAMSVGWATVWRDRLPEPASVPPIEIVSDEGQNAKDPERTDEKAVGGPSDASGTGAGGGEKSGTAGDSADGADPAPGARQPAADDDDDDDQDDDD